MGSELNGYTILGSIIAGLIVLGLGGLIRCVLDRRENKEGTYLNQLKRAIGDYIGLLVAIQNNGEVWLITALSNTNPKISNWNMALKYLKKNHKPIYDEYCLFEKFRKTIPSPLTQDVLNQRRIKAETMKNSINTGLGTIINAINDGKKTS